MIAIVGNQTYRITFGYPDSGAQNHTYCCLQLFKPDSDMPSPLYRRLMLRLRGPDERDRDILKTWEATATCSPKDTPNRRVGRKVALGRVLKAAGLDYDTRSRIWHWYLATTNDEKHRR